MTDFCQPSREVLLLADASGRKCRIVHLWMKQAGLCAYCFQRMLLEIEHIQHPSFATIDHKHPKSKGGRITRRNAVAACQKCNSTKQDLGHDEFLNQLHSLTTTESV